MACVSLWGNNPMWPWDCKTDLLFWKGWIYIRCMTTPDITPILEELAAGRIDAAEAARRIDALKASQPESETTSAEPTNEQLAGSATESDPWAAVTDQPQAAYDASAPQSDAPAEEPVRTKPINTGGVERISVRAVGRRVRIIGETSVATL